MEIREQVAQALKSQRKKRGLTQQDLSELTGIKQSTLSKVEGGKVDIRLSTLNELLNGLGLRLFIGDESLINLAHLVANSNGEEKPMFSLDDEDED